MFPPASRTKSRLLTLPASFYVTAGVLLLSFALPLPRGGSIAGMPSVCPFFNVTGVPCPGCGLTRSFVCFAHAHLSEAFRWHLLGPGFFSGALLYLLGTVLKWKWPSEKFVVAGIGIFLLMFWGLRLSGVFPMPSG